MFEMDQLIGEKRAARLSDTFEGIQRLTSLEKVLAVVCVLIPAGLWGFAGELRGSISAYHDMPNNEMYFVPLTAAAMLFVVNGLVKKQHPYNVALGVALLIVILFDHDGASEFIHGAAAVLFFLGNALVMVLFADSEIEEQVKWPLVAAIVAAVAAWKLFGWISLFWAEWASLIVVAAHFYINSRQSEEATEELAAA